MSEYSPPAAMDSGKESPPEAMIWTQQDANFTKLFQAWDNLPPYDPATETALLRDLDDIIPPFDAYINHSDAGFVAWMKRHQRAMELALAPMPRWPKLYKLDKAGDMHWKDDEWVKRYSFLVHQRLLIARSRLHQMACCNLGDRHIFFGRLLARPRQTVRTTGSKARPARLPARWYYPLDKCLEVVAMNSPRLDLKELRCQFWGTCGPVAMGGQQELVDGAGGQVKAEPLQKDGAVASAWIAGNC